MYCICAPGAKSPALSKLLLSVSRNKDEKEMQWLTCYFHYQLWKKQKKTMHCFAYLMKKKNLHFLVLAKVKLTTTLLPMLGKYLKTVFVST